MLAKVACSCYPSSHVRTATNGSKMKGGIIFGLPPFCAGLARVWRSHATSERLFAHPISNCPELMKAPAAASRCAMVL